jgi:hypothetical protein
VFESSPPITTSPSKSSFLAVSSACLNCNSFPFILSSLTKKKQREKRLGKYTKKESPLQTSSERVAPAQVIQSCLFHWQSYRNHPNKKK